MHLLPTAEGNARSQVWRQRFFKFVFILQLQLAADMGGRYPVVNCLLLQQEILGRGGAVTALADPMKRAV